MTVTFRDPAHYLKPLTTTSTPKRLMFLACHGYSSRKRDHFEQHFQAAALASVFYSDKNGTRRDTLTTYGEPAELWAAVADRCKVGRRVVLFAYDLAEQMRLSQMLTCLPAAGWSLEKIVLERTAAWCLLRNGKRSLMCCDLKSWTPVAWAKILADMDSTPETQQQQLASVSPPGYGCERRAVILREAVLQILNWIEGENLGQFRPTGSGQSFTAYRRRFIGPRLLVHDDPNRLQAERAAMHTGRAEAWRHGRQNRGPYVEYDLHAAYATIGKECAVPTIARGEARKPTLARVKRLMDRYAVLADVTVSTRVECLPYRVGNRTLWPVGTFRTLVYDPELRLALDYCDKVTVNHAWLYQRDYALREFCSYVLDGLDGQEQVYGLLPRRVLKHWSRCLVGRLGLRYRTWHKFGPVDPPDVRLIDYLDLDEGTRTEMLHAGTQALLLGDMAESPESLPQVPGWIMSECRRRLWDQMRQSGLHEIVYVDTDSIIMYGNGYDPRFTNSGDVNPILWAHKGTYPSLTIHGPRNLELGASRRVSGLPLSAKQTAPLEFEGEVMRSVKASMRNGELDCVVSVPRTFHLQSVDLRRRHNPDGSTSPFELEEA